MKPAEEIERVYQTFSRYRRPETLAGCPCCTTKEASQALLNRSLHAISEEEIRHYAAKAMTTWGEVDDYKYFLPRILELAAEAPTWEVEITFGKLPYGKFSTWPTDEKEAVLCFVFGVWKGCVSRSDLYLADSFLCGASLLFDDISPLLQHADGIDPSFKAAFAEENGDPNKRKLTNSFWNRESMNYRRAHSWLYPSPDDARR